MSSALITPSPAAIATLKEAWSWLLPEKYKPVLFSALGDMFYEVPTGEVFWLNTGAGEIEEVAPSHAEFQRLMETDAAEEWFLPDLIAELVAAGKTLAPGECYGFVILPIFEGGEYTVENMEVIGAEEHFGFTGDIHQQVHDLPDGATIRIGVGD